MKKTSKLWQFAGFAFTSFAGTILHFLYQWTNNSLLAAPFSGVNESTWEHMKLLFFPLLLFYIFQAFFFKDYECFWCINLKSTLLGLALIPIIFYTYNGIFGTSSSFINIAIFFISAAATFIYQAIHLNDPENCKFRILAFIFLCIMGILFIIFTFITPKIPIFQDPLTGGYGIK